MNISWVCEIAQVSRSGYYAWLSRHDKREERELKDRAEFEWILKAYNKRGYKKGSRGIHMTLLQMGILMNRKKVQRLMRKFNLVCPIRKANPYLRMTQAKKESVTKPNIVDRKFKELGPQRILLTDITYLFYGRGKKAYLSTIKDAYTNQILSYVLSDSLEVDFVLETIQQLFEKHSIPKNKNTLIHSDQGTHYTSIKFQTLIENHQLRQSMSRRGNCWDNAPQESFFGHMKDELPILGAINSFSELSLVIDDYMDYYNNERYQWGLVKLSPNQYADFIKTGEYPLKNLVKTPSLSQLV